MNEDAQSTRGPDRSWVSLLRKAGTKVAEVALTAFAAAKDPRTPAHHRAVLVSSLVYLGFPLDAIPDVTPVVGFADDFAAITAALAVVATSVRWRHVRQARRWMQRMGIDTTSVDEGLDDDGRAFA
jgi:uncharacterized membrane protein YkvA (DUF1232 family)